MPREDDAVVRAIDMCAHMHIDTAMVEGIHLVAAEWLLCARTCACVRACVLVHACACVRACMQVPSCSSMRLNQASRSRCCPQAAPPDCKTDRRCRPKNTRKGRPLEVATPQNPQGCEPHCEPATSSNLQALITLSSQPHFQRPQHVNTRGKKI